VKSVLLGISVIELHRLHECFNISRPLP
jgi:hypothetical protein